MTDVNELYKKRQEVFIERRTTIATEVDKFLAGVAEIEPELIKDITPLNGTTAKEVLPSMWVEPFNIEAYERELAVLNDYINKIKSVADALNAEALKVLGGA